MSDPGEPGSPSRKIIRAALKAGLGTAICRCSQKDEPDPMLVIHDEGCDFDEGKRLAQKFLHEEFERGDP